MKARKAVDDNARNRRTIKSVHSHGYRFHAEVEGGLTERNADQSQTTDQLSIAVPPFPNLNLTADPQNAYLADGLTQDIATDLSHSFTLTPMTSQ